MVFGLRDLEHSSPAAEHGGWGWFGEALDLAYEVAEVFVWLTVRFYISKSLEHKSMVEKNFNDLSRAMESAWFHALV